MQDVIGLQGVAGPMGPQGPRGPRGYAGPIGPRASLLGAAYALVFDDDTASRTIPSGAVIRMNTPITTGSIAYDMTTGDATFLVPGKYVIQTLLNVAALACGSHTKLQLLVNNVPVSVHDISIDRGGNLPIAFLDVIEVSQPYTTLRLRNSGADMVCSNISETAASLTIWGAQ